MCYKKSPTNERWLRNSLPNTKKVITFHQILIALIESQKNSIVEIYDRNRVYIHIKDEA